MAKMDYKMKGHIYYLIPIIAVATLWLYVLTCLAPSLDAENVPDLHFPSTLIDLQRLADLLRMYKDKNLLYTTVLFCSAYLYKQTFTIPGSALLNVLAGALFGTTVGFPLVCMLTAIGSSLCYLWSLWLGKDVIEHYFSEKVHALQDQVAANQHQLMFYLLFLRMLPISPNWLINLACPILGVPLRTFFFSVFLGICLVDETDPSELQEEEPLAQDLVSGVKAAYSIPAPQAKQTDDNEVDTSSLSLDELMAQMKSI